MRHSKKNVTRSTFRFFYMALKIFIYDTLTMFNAFCNPAYLSNISIFHDTAKH